MKKHVICISAAILILQTGALCAEWVTFRPLNSIQPREKCIDTTRTAKINANLRHISYQPVVKLTMNPFTNAVDTEIIGFSHKKYFPRPETLRQEVVQKKSCCKTIYSGR